MHVLKCLNYIYIYIMNVVERSQKTSVRNKPIESTLAEYGCLQQSHCPVKLN